jgi:hypothetical protein
MAAKRKLPPVKSLSRAKHTPVVTLPAEAAADPSVRIAFLLSVIKARDAELDALRIALRNSHPGVWAEIKHYMRG